MLIGSGVRLSTLNPMHQLSAPLAGSVERSAWLGHGKLRNQWAGFAGFDNKSGRPDGVRHPSAWVMPRKAGGLSARNQTDFGVALGNLNLAEGRNVDGTTTLEISVPNAALQLVVSATGTTAITFTQSGLLAGALDGSGTADFAITVPTALLGAILSGVGTGAITLTQTGLVTAYGWLEGDIVPYTELSPESLATAVWSALASANNDTGTMGEKLNDAGSASNPWTEVIESGFTAAEILKMLAAVAVGKTTVTDLGGGNATVVFRDLGDTKDVVDADLTGSDRTAVTLDP